LFTIRFFIKGSARMVESPRAEYKGFKFKFNKKGNIYRGLVVRTSFPNRSLDGSVNGFYENSIISIKKTKY